MTIKKVIMKEKSKYLILLGLLLASLSIQAKRVDVVSLNKTSSSIRSILSEIEKSTSYKFLYNENIVNADKEVSINVTNEPVDKVLKNILNDADISFTIVDNQVILSPANSKEIKQNTRSIKGIVKDVSGMELPGVSVIVKGTTNGTVTDIDGGYSLSVTDDAVLIFKYVGFITQEVKIGNQTSLNIVLKEDTKTLDEVVVVGYSTQKKADLTGAVSSVKMSNLNDLAVSNINSALQGRMSGVTVLQSSGAPGAGTAVRIRGLGTIGENNPLYVIDGMPADNMNDINPNDIERIDVLKDASSAAIYGSRAANGVVIIQTKKGSTNSKINVSLSTYHGFAKLNKKIDLLNAKERNMIHLEAYNNAIADYPGETIKIPDYYKNPDSEITRTNWQDEIFSNGAYQGNYDLTITGGSSNAKYSIMAGHLNQDGVLKRSGFKRSTVRVNTELNITKNLVFGENLMITNSKQDIVGTTGQTFGSISSALQYDPSVAVYEKPGVYSGSGSLGIDLKNPVALVDRADDAITRDRIIGNVYAQYTLKDFTLKTDFGYDWLNFYEKWFVARTPESGRPSKDNFLDEDKRTNTRWINTTTLKYDKAIASHKIMLLGGTSYEEYNSEYSRNRGADFVSEEKGQRYMDAATRMVSMSGNRQQWALQSYFARLDYTFADRYLLSANFRADGSSRFSKDNRWGYFPSVSAGWRLSEESFFEGYKDKIQNIKLRASWGTLGNQEVGTNYATKALIENTTDDDGYYVVFGEKENKTFGRYESNLPNPNLKWEVTKQTDFGLDITFLDKFDLGLDYYIKNTSDVLVGIPLPSLAGVNGFFTQNAGKVKNTGFETSLSYNTKVNDLHINAYGNFSTVKNEVISLGSGSVIYPTTVRGQNMTRITAGEPISHFFGYKTDGIFKSESEINSYVNNKGEKMQPNAKVGDVKFVDTNFDGVIDGKDRTKIGDGFPDFSYGFGLDLAYKGFDFSMFWQGVAGYDIFNALKYEGMFVSGGYNNFAAILDRFHPVNNPNGDLPKVSIKDKNGNAQMSDLYVDKGDYLRLKNLTIGYTLDPKLTNKAFLQKVRLYVTMQNLLTFTKYKGYDPELGESGSGRSREIGVDRGQFPQPKTFIMGININF